MNLQLTVALLQEGVTLFPYSTKECVGSIIFSKNGLFSMNQWATRFTNRVLKHYFSKKQPQYLTLKLLFLINQPPAHKQDTYQPSSPQQPPKLHGPSLQPAPQTSNQTAGYQRYYQ